VTPGAGTNKSFCVVGNTLHILETTPGSTDIASDLVAMKQ
jgi:hypothetical protein